MGAILFGEVFFAVPDDYHSQSRPGSPASAGQARQSAPSTVGPPCLVTLGHTGADLERLWCTRQESNLHLPETFLVALSVLSYECEYTKHQGSADDYLTIWCIRSIHWK